MRRGGRGNTRVRSPKAKKQPARRRIVLVGTAIDKDGNERRITIYENYYAAGDIYIQPDKGIKGTPLHGTQRKTEAGIRAEIAVVYKFTNIKLKLPGAAA